MSSFIAPNHLTMLTSSYFSEQRQKQNKRNEWANKHKKQKGRKYTQSTSYSEIHGPLALTKTNLSLDSHKFSYLF